MIYHHLRSLCIFLQNLHTDQSVKQCYLDYVNLKELKVFSIWIKRKWQRIKTGTWQHSTYTCFLMVLLGCFIALSTRFPVVSKTLNGLQVEALAYIVENFWFLKGGSSQTFTLIDFTGGGSLSVVKLPESSHHFLNSFQVYLHLFGKLTQTN